MLQSPYVVTLLDYGAGNVRSLRNAIRHLGYEVKDVETVDDILKAEVIVFPGQGCFRQAIQSLKEKGFYDPLQKYLLDNRPFFGICLGMQLLFTESEESPGVSGLGIIPGKVTRFSTSGAKVPQIGWNGMSQVKDSCALEGISAKDKMYFVHSYCALPTPENYDWILSLTNYASQQYISIVQKGNVMAAQCHPEKSGRVGLQLIQSFLSRKGELTEGTPYKPFANLSELPSTQLAKRVIACLDVRSNDAGDLVVTKGDQYDVRESSVHGRGGVRNLGKPVALCQRYYDDGADEVAFLNITSFRQGVLDDMPMLQVLESASENVFVPLTVGGGIREYIDSMGKSWSSLEVAGRYFRAGADKVSIGSDAVYSAESFLATRRKDGASSIEQISSHYGAQAVVVSIDPKRVYVPYSAEIYGSDGNQDHLSRKTVVELPKGQSGPKGERFCWWQVTVKGGREVRDLDAVQLAKISEILGAGEIMLNCIDMDGQGQGYDLALIQAVQSAVTIPVIASSGAGNAHHFYEVFQRTGVNAALAAGIFHRQEVTIPEVKNYLAQREIEVRQ